MLPLNSVQLFNFRARSIVQSATASSALAASPYTQLGLRGLNQVVNIADTGVDVTSCYFSDPQGSVPPSNLSTPTFNSSFRY